MDSQKPFRPEQIKIGPAGWHYADWEGIVYPSRRPRGFHELEYLSRFFDTVEINTSFYQSLRPAVVNLWTRQVSHNPGFRFTAKLWQRFTHQRFANRADERAFKEGLNPLYQRGKLGALLMQFPWSFKNTPESRNYLAGLVMQFMEYPLVVEVRHGSWNHPEVFQMLRELEAGFCNIDQPRIGHSLAPTERVTTPLGYARFHGRNYEQWFSNGDHPEERYNYLYSLSELRAWEEKIRHIAARSEVTYVITNNHYQGKSIANALQMVHLLGRRPVRGPEELVHRYPELAPIVQSAADARLCQRELPFTSVPSCGQTHRRN